jgi:hypothetical protein
VDGTPGLLFGPLQGARRRRSTRPGAGPAGSSAAPAAGPETAEADIDALADAFLARAAEAEARLTPVVDELARASGGELLGLEHRLKPAGSVRRKLAEVLADAPDSSAEEVLAGLTDAVRYTVGFAADGYPERAASVLEALAEAGYEAVGCGDPWDEPYPGMVSCWLDGDSIFEVRLDTVPSTVEGDAGVAGTR